MCLQHCILANAILIFTGGSSVLCVKIPQIPPAFVHLRPSPLALLDYVALSVELSGFKNYCKKSSSPSISCLNRQKILLTRSYSLMFDNLAGGRFQYDEELQRLFEDCYSLRLVIL
ncbi:PREDICTED: uncharacterized protein LOC109216284 isoform X1 [Nicotiana attenuata]|uniref:uncharacterized protein LOC109216284 isoform X1 n=1 Tax=Nicotiana attenuata TaxID=49451 RepID=UPI00090562CB|nr:PREDICTED: uncharacterized protein LOC109216284 isoform X1 [Nicotiana attenuata]